MRVYALFFCLILIVSSAQVYGGILSSQQEIITFQPTKAPAGATWDTYFNLTDAGLVLGALPAPNARRDTWVQSQPFPIGYSWRPPSSAGFRIYLDGSFGENSSGGLRIFIRYSCDKNHWSTWYEAISSEEKSPEGSKIYRETISIPGAGNGRYYSLMQDWRDSKPAWSSDETDFCEWLIQKEPDFFAKEFPFIGYVQVRLEKWSTQSAEQLKAITVESTWAISGLTSFVSDKSRVRKNTEDKWFFTGKSN
jgi:hypothetical protein